METRNTKEGLKYHYYLNDLQKRGLQKSRKLLEYIPIRYCLQVHGNSYFFPLNRKVFKKIG